MKRILLAALIALASVSGAAAQCSGQFANNRVCGNTSGGTGLPGPITVPAGALTPIAGGTVLGNPTTSTAAPVATTAPILGIPGTSTGQQGFAGATSGTATVKAQPAAGTPTLLWPTTSGTLMSVATAPLVLNAVTGGLTCPTCVTSSGGGAITGTAPVAVSAAGVVSITGSAGGVLAGSSPAFTPTPVFGVPASVAGTLGLANGSGSGATITLKNLAATSAYNFNLPSTAGTAGQIFQSAGGVATSNVWTTATYPATAAAGTVLNANPANTITATATPVLGTNGGTGGAIVLNGATSGASTIRVPAAAGTGTIFQVPGTNGSSGQALLTDGAGNTSWASIPPGFSNTRLAKTANYTAASADCGDTLALGGTAQFTLTVSAASGYTTTCVFLIVNEDTTRAKDIAINGITAFKLWPLQSFFVTNNNNVWEITGLSRYKLPATRSMYVNPSTGNDANDCLTIGAPCLTLPGVVAWIQQWDLNGFRIANVEMADGTYTAGVTIDGPWLGAQTSGNAITQPDMVTPVVFNGTSGVRANVIVSNASSACFKAQNQAAISVANMTLRCVYDVWARHYGVIYVLGGIAFDTVNVASSVQIYATSFGLIDVSGGNYIVDSAAAGQTASFIWATHHGNARLTTASIVIPASGITYALATAYALTMGEVTVTGGSFFDLSSGGVVTGQCWQASNGAIQWSGGSITCNSGVGFPGSIAGAVPITGGAAAGFGGFLP